MDDVIKVTKKQAMEIERIIKSKTAFIAAESVHIAALARQTQAVEEAETQWWEEVLSTENRADFQYSYDKTTKSVRRNVSR